MLGFLQRFDSESTRNSWKAFKKILHLLAVLQVFKEGLYRHARASEYGHAMHGIGIADDRG